MATPVTIHPPHGSRSRPVTVLGLLLWPRLAVVRRVEPSALVARGKRLEHPLDLLPGRRAGDQAVFGHALLDLERRAVLAAVHIHGHGQPRIISLEASPPLKCGTGPAVVPSPQGCDTSSRFDEARLREARRERGRLTGTRLRPSLMRLAPQSIPCA